MSEKLAIHGGPKAKTTPNFPMYPGGLEIGEDEYQCPSFWKQSFDQKELGRPSMILGTSA